MADHIDTEIGVRYVDQGASRQIISEIQRILREADAAGKAHGGFLDPHVADQFGEKLGAAIRKAVNQDMSSSPLYKMLRNKDQNVLKGLEVPPSTSRFLQAQLDLARAEQKRYEVAARAKLTPGVRDKSGQLITSAGKLETAAGPGTGDQYIARAFPDVATRTGTIRAAESAYGRAAGRATKARDDFIAELRRPEQEAIAAARAEAEARAKGALQIAQANVKRQQATDKAIAAEEAASHQEAVGRTKVQLQIAQGNVKRQQATDKAVAAEEAATQKATVARLKSVLSTVAAEGDRRKRTENAALAEQKASGAATNAINRRAESERNLDGRTRVAITRRTEAMDKAAAAEETRVRKLSAAQEALNFPVSFPDAAQVPGRLGAAQERVNVSERRVADANLRLAEVRDSEVANAHQAFTAQNALDNAMRAETAARLQLTQEQRRNAELLAKNSEGKLGIGAQFKQGFVGVAEKPFTEQIGQAFKFSLFYGTAYKMLFALTQTFQQTLQEGIAFQQAVTDLALATGRSRDEAEELANNIGHYASQFGYAPSLAAQIGGRAQGFYGTTGSDDKALQDRVAATSARVVTQIAFASGKDPQDIQSNLAAVTAAYGLGFQSQQYIGDLDAYFSKRFGIAPGNTIDAVAQAGTVGRAAGFSPAEVSSIAAIIQARMGASSSATGGYLAQIFSRAGEGSLVGLDARYGINQNADFATQFRALAGIYKNQPDQRDDISAVFGRGKSQDAVIALLQSFDEVTKAAKEADAQAPGALQKATDMRLSDIGGQIQTTVGALRDFANTLSQSGLLTDLGVLVVGLRELLGGVDEVVKAFNTLPGPLRDIAIAAGLASAGLKIAAAGEEGRTVKQLLFEAPSAAGVIPNPVSAIATPALTAEATAASELATTLAAEAAAANAAAAATGVALAEAQDNVAMVSGQQRLAAAQSEAALAAERHTAALAAQTEATNAAFVAANEEAAAEQRLAVAQAEAAASAGTSAVAANKGGLLRNPDSLKGMGLAALAVVDLLLINKVRAVAKEQDAAKKDYIDYQTSIGDSNPSTAEGQRSIASQAKAIADQNAAASDGRFDRFRNIGSRLFGGQSSADEARARETQAKADQALATANAQLIDKYNASSDPTQALVTGYDADALKSSLDAITASGGTAKEQFDALRLSVQGSGEAAARAAANYHPDQVAAENGLNLYQKLIDNPAVSAYDKPNTAGKLLNGFIKEKTFGAYDGPIDTKDVTKEIYTKAFTRGGVQKRLSDALGEIGSLADLDPSTIDALASQIVGNGAQDVINASGGRFSDKDYDSIQQQLVGQTKQFLEDLKEKATGVNTTVALTSGELTLLADNTMEQVKAVIDSLPKTSHKDRIATARQAVAAIQDYIRKTPGGATPEALKDLQDARNLLAQSQFDQLEALREVAQRNAHSRAEAAQLGRGFLRRELRAAIGAGDADLLATIVGQAGEGAVRIAKQMIREAKAAARAKAAVDAKVASLMDYLSTGDLVKPGQTGTGGFDAGPLQEAINTTPSAEDGSNVYDGTGVGPQETEADKAVARAQANAIRKQGQIAGARADIMAANVAMNQAKKGSVAYFGALGQLYQAQQELASALIAYRQNLYLLGHDATNPLVQARAALIAARQQFAADQRSGAGADQLAADRVAVQSAQANAESTKFSQRLDAVQTADDLGRISHQKYLNYLQHEHDRLEAVKHRTFQQQDELNQIDRLMKEAADKMAGQWNFGDIKLPTPYEVQRRVQEVYGNAVGGLNNSSDPFLANGAISDIHGVQAPASQSHVNQIWISGADIGAVRKVLKEILGDRAVTSTTASRHR